MWYMRAFEKQDDRLIAEFPLPNVDLGTLRKLWNRPDDDPMQHVYPVSPHMVETLSKYVEHKFDFESYDYFLDYDA